MNAANPTNRAISSAFPPVLTHAHRFRYTVIKIMTASSVAVCARPMGARAMASLGDQGIYKENPPVARSRPSPPSSCPVSHCPGPQSPRTGVMRTIRVSTSDRQSHLRPSAELHGLTGYLSGSVRTCEPPGTASRQVLGETSLTKLDCTVEGQRGGVRAGSDPAAGSANRWRMMRCSL